MALAWLTVLAPHTWVAAPGVTHAGPQVVHVGPGIDPAPVTAALADMGAGWTWTTDPPTYRPGEVDVELGPTARCGNDPAGDWACTRTQVAHGAVVWAQIDLNPHTPPTVLAWVWRHELGEAIGLAHSPDADDVMHPGRTGRPTYSPGDHAGITHLRSQP